MTLDKLARADWVWGISVSMWGLWIIVTAWAMVTGEFSTACFAFITLVASLAPIQIPRHYGVHIPSSLMITIVVFSVSTIWFGEHWDMYETVWWWDLWLHAGFAFGFTLTSLVILSLSQRTQRIPINPWIMAVLVFCLAVTFGVFWEIFEYTMDTFADTNMQRSGLPDTMTDLITNIVGAIVGAMFGYQYLKLKSENKPLNRSIFRLIDEAITKNTAAVIHTK